MKTYFVFLCVIISGGLANATTQTAVSQDKPPYVYIESYKMSDQASGTYHSEINSGDYEGEWVNQFLTCNANIYGVIDGTNGLVGAGRCDEHLQQNESNGTAETSDDSCVVEITDFVPTLIETSYSSFGGYYTNIYVNWSFPIYQEHCDINDPSFTSVSSGDMYTFWSATHRHGAQAILKLKTGGKVTSRLRNLFGLTGTAVQSIPPSFFPGIWDQTARGYWNQTSGTNFPSQKITIGTYGALNANGVLYTSLPDNADVDVTPYVAGEDNYTFNVSELKYKLTIIARGNGTNYDLSTNTPEFCVGQLLTFAPSWSPSTPPYVNSVQHWTLPDKYVNQPTNYSATCATYVKNTDLLTNLANQCWFVNGSGGTASIGMNLQFTNGQTASVAAKGSFSVYRPTATDEVEHPGVVSLDGDFYLQDAPVDFYGHVQSAYHGAANWTQLVNRDCQQAFYIETGTGGNYWLDTHQFYSNQTNSEVGPGLNNRVPLEDAPEVLIDVHVSNIDKFKTYLMFKPDGDSIWVTLGRTDWGWNGDAFPGLLQDGGITAPQYTPTDEFPVWPDVFTSSEQ